MEDMSWRDRDPVRKIILKAEGDKAIIEKGIAEQTANDPFFPLQHIKAREYLDHSQIRSAIEQVLKAGHPEKYLPHFGFFRQHLQDEELRPHVLNIHEKHPWQFYIHGEKLKDLFPSLFFKDLSIKDKDFLKDPNLGPIFLLYYSNLYLSAVNPKLREYFVEHIEEKSFAGVRIEEPKDPGFACGGMEKNYRQAAKNNTGLCRVNGGLLLAKLYHAKQNVDAKKIAYICRDSQVTTSGQILWSNYLYAPTEGQHQIIIDAISRGQKDVHVDGLKIKPIRPLIGETSRSIYSLFDKGDFSDHCP
jgi:hypothetical protein